MAEDGAPVRRLLASSGWRRVGQSLVRELWFPDFDQAFACLERLAREAADYSRRPDLCIFDYNRVRVVIANPNDSGLTEAELRLARRVDAVLDPERERRSRRAPAVETGTGGRARAS